MRRSVGIWAIASFLALTGMGLALPTHAQEASDLDGYSTLNVSAEFETFLNENPNIKRRLQQNEQLSKALLSDRSLQAELLSGKATLFEIQRDLMRESASETTGGRQAERNSERKSAGNDIQLNERGSARAQENINKALGILEAERQEAQEVAQVAQERQEAIEELIKDLAENNPDALALFLADGDLQQQIMDGAMSITDVMAQLNVEVKEAQEEALATTVAAEVENDENTEAVDMNRVPTVAEAELDANGWPKYLNVPESCPGPEEDMAYIYEPYGVSLVHGPEWKDEGPLKMNQHKETIAPYFRRGNNPHTPFITDKEIIAAPFYADNVEGLYGRIDTERPWPQIPMARQYISLSYCPGDFENKHTPEGRPEMNCNGGIFKAPRYTTLFADNPIRKAINEKLRFGSGQCFLEPGEHYFYNVRIEQSEESDLGTCMELYGPGSFHDKRSQESDLFTSYKDTKKRTVKGEELPLCGMLVKHGGQMHSPGTRPPYTGPFLGLKGPYPVNYGGALVPRHIQEERHAASGCNMIDNAQTFTYSCYDPADKLPPQKFTTACVNGQHEWIEGKNKPAYPQYRCELIKDGESYYETYNTDGHGPSRQHYIPCAAHRDGQTKKMTCSDGYSRYTRDEQCQFDNNQGRYDWVTTDVSHPGMEFPSVGGHGKCKYSYNTENIPPHKDKCIYLGKTYDIGTTIQASCTNNANSHYCKNPESLPEGSECKDNGFGRVGVYRNVSFTCEQTADAPALPRFVHKTGIFAISPGSQGPFQRSNCDISVVE